MTRAGILVAAFLFALPAFAQQTPVPAADPIEVTAASTLEWHRADNKFIARGSVEAKQGTQLIRGDTLTAEYRDGVNGGMEIWRLTSEGNVSLSNQDSTAYGEHAVYDVDKGVATLTGGNLRLVSPGQTVTASQRLEYYTARGEASAIGNAKVVRGEDTLSADVIDAVFAQGSSQGIETLEARGNVVVVTPAERLTGDYGIYHASTNMAEVTGNVRIVRGPNILEGARAEVDMGTDISRIFGGPDAAAGDGRVRGVFYPKSKDGGSPSQ